MSDLTPKLLKRFGPFEIVERLGSGGMGSVYKVRKLRHKTFYALKVASPMVAQEEVLVLRFKNEFAILQKFPHENIVKVYEEGEEDGLPYFLMEYVPGLSLEKQILKKGRMQFPEALTIITQITEAVGHLHQCGLIHRDVKPANILLNDHGAAKLTDLGLAKDNENLLTQTATGMGTLEFAPPEQFEDAKTVDHRCDIYGLAGTLYYCVTGKFPYGRGSLAQSVILKQEHKMVRLAKVLPACSPTLDLTIYQALSPHPQERPASTEEFLAGILGATVVNVKTEVDPPPLASPSDPDKRAQTRHPISLDTSAKLITSPRVKAMSAQILDLSEGGLCLKIERRFEPNVLLEVSLPDPKGGMDSSYILKTCWTKKLGEGAWAVGCSFVQPLQPRDIDLLLLSDANKTIHLKRVGQGK